VQQSSEVVEGDGPDVERNDSSSDRVGPEKLRLRICLGELLILLPKLSFYLSYLPVIRTSSVSIPFIRSRSEPSRSQILKMAIDRTSDSFTEQI
jgi:hypothetical protein